MKPAASMWRCGRYRYQLEVPLVMGILNVTPDSFSDGGLHAHHGDAVEAARAMMRDGAAIIDVGGESTRPGSAPVDEAQELERVRAVVETLAHTQQGVAVSIDTRHAAVARACVDSGASIINDISGFEDPAMMELAVQSYAGLVVMHMQGEPGTMQAHPHYDDVVGEVEAYLLGRAHALEEAGVHPECIAIDPGIGFGKTLEHNLLLMAGLDRLAAHGYPVVLGASRKRFIGEITGESHAASRVGGSVGAALAGAARGVSVVRVHDVAQTVQALAVARAVDDAAFE